MGLGNEGSNRFTSIVEKFPIPETGGRRALVSTVEGIIKLNGVQKIVIELNKPIIVTRLVDGSQEVPQELVNDDIMSAARNAEIQEFLSQDNELQFKYLYRAFSKLSEKRLQPKVFLTHKLKELEDWLNLELTSLELFGVEVLEHLELPEDTMLLIASTFNDPDMVTFSLKLDFQKTKRE